MQLDGPLSLKLRQILVGKGRGLTTLAETHGWWSRNLRSNSGKKLAKMSEIAYLELCHIHALTSWSGQSGQRAHGAQP